MPSNDIAAFQEILKQSKNIIAVAGAGLSAASGIPTFRGSGGMWRRFDAMSLATPEAFDDNPARVWQFYHYRREKALAASPNAAHLALASLSLPSVRETVAAGSTFTLITQNVDGLSRRAHEIVLERASLIDREAAKAQDQEQPHMLEMHGRLFEVQCTDVSCGYSTIDMTSPICAALAGTEALLDEGVAEPEIPESALPRCNNCGALARPGVVWFGEAPQYLDLIDELVTKADLCIVVGTSSTVLPAAVYSSLVKNNGGKVADFNVERTKGGRQADFLFIGPCEITLPRAIGLQCGQQEHNETGHA